MQISHKCPVTLSNIICISRDKNLYRTKIEDESTRKKLLDNAKNLRGSPFNSVYISRDLTFNQRREIASRHSQQPDTGPTNTRTVLANTSMGPDGLHPYLLKSCPSLAGPLHIIFKKSLSTGKLSLPWKNSTIIPIFKKGSHYISLNSRPISLTSVCCKTLERIISDVLYNFLESNRLLTDDQFRFRQGRTVEDQLLLV